MSSTTNFVTFRECQRCRRGVIFAFFDTRSRRFASGCRCPEGPLLTKTESDKADVEKRLARMADDRDLYEAFERARVHNGMWGHVDGCACGPCREKAERVASAFAPAVPTCGASASPIKTATERWEKYRDAHDTDNFGTAFVAFQEGFSAGIEMGADLSAELVYVSESVGCGCEKLLRGSLKSPGCVLQAPSG